MVNWYSNFGPPCAAEHCVSAALQGHSLNWGQVTTSINIINIRRLRQNDMAPVRAGKFVRHGVSTKLQEVATQGMASRSTGNWPGHCQRRHEDQPHTRTIQTERIATDGERWCQKHPPPCPRQNAAKRKMDAPYLI